MEENDNPGVMMPTISLALEELPQEEPQQQQQQQQQQQPEQQPVEQVPAADPPVAEPEAPTVNTSELSPAPAGPAIVIAEEEELFPASVVRAASVWRDLPRGSESMVKRNRTLARKKRETALLDVLGSPSGEDFEKQLSDALASVQVLNLSLFFLFSFFLFLSFFTLD